MIKTEAEYQQALFEVKNLKNQYVDLSEIDKRRPYIGQQMARDIYRLTSEAKLYEYNRFEKSFKPVAD